MGLKDQGWIQRNCVIWKKSNPKPSSSKTNLTPTYEFIFHLVKTVDYYYELPKVPLSKNTKPSHPPRHRNLNVNGGLKSYSPYIPSSDGKNRGDHWDHIETSVVTHSDLTLEHPAPFSPELVKIPLLASSREGDLVLDPFSGLGTVGKVANEYGRRFVGYDLNQRFVEYSLSGKGLSMTSR